MPSESRRTPRTKELRNILGVACRPPVATCRRVGPHPAGAPDVPVTLVEYGDFECPFSGMADPEIKVIHRRLGDRLRFVYRHLIRIRNVGGRLPKAG
jgi:hypothetical protein